MYYFTVDSILIMTLFLYPIIFIKYLRHFFWFFYILLSSSYGWGRSITVLEEFGYWSLISVKSFSYGVVSQCEEILI